VTEAFEMARDPFTLCACLEENAGRRTAAQHGGEAVTARHDAQFQNASVVLPDAELTLALVQIESYRIHGGWPPGLCLVARR